jgi:DNA-binding XRE family transcriptional regulator
MRNAVYGWPGWLRWGMSCEGLKRTTYAMTFMNCEAVSESGLRGRASQPHLHWRNCMTKRTKKTSDGTAILDGITGKDPKIQALLSEEAENLRIAKNIYELRNKAGLSQVELAKRIGTTQSVISRLEDADYEGHSLHMLQRVAAALDKRIEIHWVPARRKSAFA